MDTDPTPEDIEQEQWNEWLWQWVNGASGVGVICSAGGYTTCYASGFCYGTSG